MMRKRVVYTDPFVPMEWIFAHELLPCRITPVSSNQQSVAQGLCPFADSLLYGMTREDQNDLLILTTSCDQMRRLPEWIAPAANQPIFLLNVPKTWKSENAKHLYRDELYRLSHFLQHHGGQKPDDPSLTTCIKMYDSVRRQLQSTRKSRSSKEFTQTIIDFHKNGIPVLSRRGRAVEKPGVPIAITGSPLFEDHLFLFDIAQESNGRIDLDATESGELSLPGHLQESGWSSDPLHELVRIYWEIPAVYRRPNTLLYEYLLREIHARRIKGLIVVYHTWCDLWHAELPTIKETITVPVLELCLDQVDSKSAHQRIKTRIQAFMETIS